MVVDKVTKYILMEKKKMFEMYVSNDSMSMTQSIADSNFYDDVKEAESDLKCMGEDGKGLKVARVDISYNLSTKKVI